MNNFGKHLKELRKEKNLNIEQLSKQIGYSKSIISYWENGQREPTMSAIMKCAEYFNVTSDYLLGLEDDFGARSAASGGALNEGDLTEEERQLVLDYRSLTPGLKDMIKRSMDIYTKRDTLRTH